MNNFKQLFYYMIGRVPAELKEDELEGKTLLHISDTPSSFFGELSRLIWILKPDYIVHTGDLVDNIKLELYPGSLWRYERDVKRLIGILEQSNAKELYFALGNHDDEQTVKRLSKRIHIIEDAQNINIEGVEFAISHYAAKLMDKPGDINLYGHDLSMKSGILKEKIFLNGITRINLIELEHMRYHSYPYPAGTDHDRSGRGKIGL